MKDFVKFYTHSVSDTMFLEAFSIEGDKCTFFLVNRDVSYPVRAQRDKESGIYKAGGNRSIRGVSSGSNLSTFYTEFTVSRIGGALAIIGTWVETDGCHRDEYMYSLNVDYECYTPSVETV